MCCRRFIAASQMILCVLQVPQGCSFSLWRCLGNSRTCPTRVFASASSEGMGLQRTLADGSYVSEIQVKKSRFIGYAKQVQTWSQAQVYIDEIKGEHPKARHWCFGFRTGSNPVNERSSDDGEPTGTAGAPILNAIRGEELSDTICVVVRYFGGVKLGAGGLIRAYGAAARQVLREAPVDILIPMSIVQVKVDACHVGSLYDLVGKYSATTSAEKYQADGSVHLTVTCESACLDDFCASLNDATRGQAELGSDGA